MSEKSSENGANAAAGRAPTSVRAFAEALRLRYPTVDSLGLRLADLDVIVRSNDQAHIE